MKQLPNNRVESNRRCFSPSLHLDKLGSAFCAPPTLSPAVAHSKRSASGVILTFYASETASH